jgi:hypothetical protein
LNIKVLDTSAVIDFINGKLLFDDLKKNHKEQTFKAINNPNCRVLTNWFLICQKWLNHINQNGCITGITFTAFAETHLFDINRFLRDLGVHYLSYDEKQLINSQFFNALDEFFREKNNRLYAQPSNKIRNEAKRIAKRAGQFKGFTRENTFPERKMSQADIEILAECFCLAKYQNSVMLYSSDKHFTFLNKVIPTMREISEDWHRVKFVNQRRINSFKYLEPRKVVIAPIKRLAISKVKS